MQPSDEQCAALGQALGHAHVVTQDFTGKRENRRGPHWWQQTAHRLLPHLTAAQKQLLEDELAFISEKTEGILALFVDDAVLGIELPATVVLEIEECSPPIKGASQSARTKPATLTSGLVVQVPEYLTPGENIKVNTETRDFVSRA